jgi:ribonuclease HI
MGGVGGSLYLSENNLLSFSTSLGEATNKFSELMTLYLLLLLDLEKNIRQLNIFGDSMLVIQVMKDTHILRSYSMFPILEEIKRYSAKFTHISFTHVYKNQTKKVDQVSKAIPDLEKGSRKIKEKGLNSSVNIFTSLGLLSD